MYKIYKQIFFFLLIAMSLNAYTFKGKIVDAKSQKAISGVRIEIQGKTKVLFSDKKGEWFLNIDDDNKYGITIYSPGYIPVNTIIGGKGLKDKIFALKEDKLLRHELVVTATKTNHTVGDVPVASIVVSKKEIEEKGIKDIVDVFETIPGLRISKRSGSWGNKGNISIQGMPSNYTLILVDGQKYIGGHGGVDLASIPVDMIERIEVVKGPSSVLYGSDAIGGIVNIITKSGSDQKSEVSLKSAAGSDKLMIYEAGGHYNTGKFSACLNFTKRDCDGINKETDVISESNIGGNLSYKFSPNIKWSLSPRYEYTKLDKQDRIQKRTAINSNFEIKDNKGGILNLRYSVFNYNHYTENKSSDWDDTLYELELTGTKLLFNNHLLSAGYHMVHEKIDDRGKGYDANQTTNSFFLQDEMSFKPVTFVLGARLDNHKEWGTQFNPKASLKADITSDLTLKASYGRSFKAPKLVSLFGGDWMMGPMILVKSNPDLKPETSWGAQIGLEWEVLDKVVLTGSYFHNKIENMIKPKLNRRRRPWVMTWDNIDEAITKGVELGLRASVTPDFRIDSGITFLKTEDCSTGEELFERPKFDGFIGLNYNFRQIGLNVNLTGKITGKRDISKRVGKKTIREELSSYSTFDLALNQKIGKKFKIFARLINIFDKKDVSDEYDIAGFKFLAGIELSFK